LGGGLVGQGRTREDARGQPSVSAAMQTRPRFRPVVGCPARRDHPFLGWVYTLGHVFIRFDLSRRAGVGWVTPLEMP
jgi:hypothetical protein